MTGKEKCEMLKNLRREIAIMNHINLPESPLCTYQGPCPGFCEVCDGEAKWLSARLNALKASGREIQYLSDYKKLIEQIPKMNNYEAKYIIAEKKRNLDRIIYIVNGKIRDLRDKGDEEALTYYSNLNSQLYKYSATLDCELNKILHESRETMGIMVARPYEEMVKEMEEKKRKEELMQAAFERVGREMAKARGEDKE